MKRILLIFILSVFCVYSVKSENQSNESNFHLMSGYGYSHGEFISGFSNVNSLVYKFHNKWGVGFDINFLTGDRSSMIGGGHLYKDEMTSMSVGPNAYFFLLDNSKHITYLSAGVNYTHKSMTMLQDIETSNGDLKQYWYSMKNSIFGLNASAGYSYKITSAWGVGARCYFQHIEEWNVMGLFNITLSF